MEEMLQWAAEHPALYHILFYGVGARWADQRRHLDDPGLLATMGNVQACIDQGLIRAEVDAQLITLSLWATVHGFASLTVSFRHIPVPLVEPGHGHRLATPVAIAADPPGSAALRADALLARR